MTDFNALVHERLTNLVRASGLHPKVIATAAGISYSMVHRYLAGENTPTIENLAKLAEVLGTSASDILQEDREPIPREVTPQDALQILAQALTRLDYLETRNRELEILYGKPTRSPEEIMSEMEAEMGIGQKDQGKKRG